MLEGKDMKMQLQGFPACPKGPIKRLGKGKCSTYTKSLFLPTFFCSVKCAKKVEFILTNSNLHLCKFMVKCVANTRE